jgi:hypothetical protein
VDPCTPRRAPIEGSLRIGDPRRRALQRGDHSALLFQRPFDVALDGISIREPEGEEFLRARTVRLEVTVLRRPWRVVIDRALLADGAWRMASKKLGQQATVAFRSIPAGGRAQCRAPAPPGPPPRQGPLLILHEATLRNLDVVLSFPSWAVALDSVNAHGSVEVRGAAESTQILFDVRDVRNRQRRLPAGRPGRRDTRGSL